MTIVQKIDTCLWFDHEAEEAATLYVSLFDDSAITHVTREGDDGPARWVGFTLSGQAFMALNGAGAERPFTEAASLFVHCRDQSEVDRLWTALTDDGGQESMCGWLKDRFGVSWQIIPDRLGELLGDPDPARAGRAMEAMLRMRKIDIAALEAAVDGAP
jgi:predicted 3-demethylubiquinone-9 3-methyltransferase (glyoxalase superfamily)